MGALIDEEIVVEDEFEKFDVVFCGQKTTFVPLRIGQSLGPDYMRRAGLVTELAWFAEMTFSPVLDEAS